MIFAAKIRYSPHTCILLLMLHLMLSSTCFAFQTQDSIHLQADDTQATDSLGEPSSKLSFLRVKPLKLTSGVLVRYGVIMPRHSSSHHPPPSVLLFLSGRGGWIEKYIQVYMQLHEKLLRPIIVLDRIGEGESGGHRGHIQSYDEYVDALVEVLDDAFSHAPDYSIIAHSTGGLIALYGALKGKLSPQHIVLTAPLLQMRSKPVPRVIARPLSALAVRMGLAKMRVEVKSEIHYPFAENRLTSDAEQYSKLQEDPYPIPAPSMGWINATFNAQHYINNPDNLKHLAASVLIFQAEEEHVVSPEGIKTWVSEAQKLHGNAIQALEIPSAKHELLKEKPPIISKIIQRMVEFLRSD